ncbi:unnamed protein product [Bursaphelenchus okinawaensis]|uniref:Major facilitator superfamily (MFS) profile domain-containing protein n=1 Tax=Bursaphelenchus okinawaensis TaxID=465554 RepID=A0A811KWL8_9BILA|nr:unnamed protein product [Bursaphelenchus okinawaensis]CAG9113356.1 unnamed protein product [Bursaphelenchus okinawaensis]
MYRYFVLTVSLLGFMMISSNTFAFNIAIVCMSSNSTSDFTAIDVFPPIDYSPYQVSQINWAVGLGSVAGTIPFAHAFYRFGARVPFLIGLLISSVATFLFPFAAEWNYYSMLFLRFLQGFTFSADFSSIGLVTSKWASLKQSGFFLSVLCCHVAMSTGLTNAFSGQVCDSSYGWPYVYFGHGCIGLILAVLWWLVYEDEPHQCNRVSSVELEKIQRNRNLNEIGGATEPIPYKKLLTDPIIWSFWFNGFAEIMASGFVQLYAAYYIKYALNFDVEATGFLSGLTTFAQCPTRLVFGYLADKWTSVGEDFKLKLFNTITLFGGGVFLMCIGLAPEGWSGVAIVAFVCFNLVTGFSTVSFCKAIVLYSRQHGYFVMGITQFMNCVQLFFGPAMVALFVTDKTSKTEWIPVYGVMSGFMLVASIVFLKWSSGHPPAYIAEGIISEDDVEKSKKMSAEGIEPISVDQLAVQNDTDKTV